jgi:allantoicase
MGEGWETARRRGGGNDWVVVRLGVPGTLRLAELDTTWFVGNAPGEAVLRGRDAVTGEAVDLLPRAPLRPDTRHRFLLPPHPAVDEVRLDVLPDGGMARLRLLGTPSPAGRLAAGLRWFDGVSARTAAAALTEAGLAPSEADALVDRRPVRDTEGLPPAVRVLLAGPEAR